MMAEKILEKETCQACGANARRNSTFCYNCGSAMAPETNAKTENYVGVTVGDALKRENLKEDSEANKQRITNKLDEPIPKPTNLPINTTKLNDAKNPVAEKEYNLKTAAELRQEAKTALNKPVKISWQEPSNAPNIWFVIATIILTLFAVGILIAMIYIR
jgi:hypothetical protein